MDDNVPDTPPVVVVPAQEDREVWNEDTPAGGVRAAMDSIPLRRGVRRVACASAPQATPESPFEDKSERSRLISQPV